MSKDLEKRIAAQREREQTLTLMRKRKKKEADEEAFSNVIAECRDKKNRRKLVVTLERVLDDDENELNEESPLVVKVSGLTKLIFCQYFKRRRLLLSAW